MSAPRRQHLRILASKTMTINTNIGWILKREAFSIAGEFRIARGAKTEAEVIVLTLGDTQGGKRNRYGVAECVPYKRYGETCDSVEAQIAAALADTQTVDDMQAACEKMRAGAARNAVDCALWDLRAKQSSTFVHTSVCAAPPRPVQTAFTLSLDTPEKMADAARRAAHRGLIKIKLGGDDDIACMHAVVANAPDSDIIVDANEGWTGDKLSIMMREAARLHIALVEQPLPVDDDAMLARIPHPVPICADESAHVTDDLQSLCGRYDVVNIKLDKAGGLTEALKMRRQARELGFGVMVGCMVGTSLAMAPAVLLAQDADYIDLDGPLLLARDRSPALHYYGELVSPPEPALWG